MFAALKNYLKSEYCKQYPTITVILNKGREYKYTNYFRYSYLMRMMEVYSHIHLQMMNPTGVSRFNDTKIIGCSLRSQTRTKKYNNPINLLWKRQKACSTGIWGGIIYSPEQFG